jgi:glycosyltransferase involved in cell wall biosynthesis
VSETPERPLYSVIIPTLDEESEIEPALRSARDALGDRAELIVVDGGSRDRTRSLARGLARVIETRPGRGHQLAAGVAESTGHVLVLLHADTHLDPATESAIAGALVDDATVGGCSLFGVRPVPSRFGKYRLLEAAVNLRTRLFRTATGDQAIFVTRDAYDVVLARSLRGCGRFAILETTARTSRRRWESKGFWKTVALHWLLRAGFAAGVSPRVLARSYSSVSRRR